MWTNAHHAVRGAREAEAGEGGHVVVVHSGGRGRPGGWRPEVSLRVDVTVRVHVVTHGVVAVERMRRAEPAALGAHAVPLEGFHHVAHHPRQRQTRPR